MRSKLIFWRWNISVIIAKIFW